MCALRFIEGNHPNQNFLRLQTMPAHFAKLKSSVTSQKNFRLAKEDASTYHRFNIIKAS
jgi:hypothetical protein